MKSEWRKCPRCKTKNLKPELLASMPDGSDMIWWVCENHEVCLFPMDMPPEIYHVTQTAFQKQQGFIPLPKILDLPEEFQYMYPLTFSNSPAPSRCSTALCSKANSKNETNESSDTTSLRSESTSGKDHLKADNIGLNSPITQSSSSAKTAVREPEDNIDEDVEEATNKQTPAVRVVRRKRPQDWKRSWVALIEKVASDPHASGIILRMEESELFHRMKEFFEAQYFQRTSVSYKRPSTGAVMYRLDDVENCLQMITQSEWNTAKKKIPHLSFDEKHVMKTGTTEEMLECVGIDLRQRKRAVGEKVEKVMRGFSVENLAKRRKMEEDRRQDQKKKEESLKSTIHQSVSARLLNRKLKREDEERSRTCTPAPSYCSEPGSSFDFEREEPQNAPIPPQNVRFHVGDGEEEDQQWGFDLDGLYEDLHAEKGVSEPLDPMEAMLFQVDEPVQEQPEQDLEHLEQPAEHSDDEGNRGEEEEDYYNFNGDPQNSNFDFVNENFEF